MASSLGSFQDGASTESEVVLGSGIPEVVAVAKAPPSIKTSSKSTEPSEASILGLPTTRQHVCTTCKLQKDEQYMSNKQSRAGTQF
jgi:hypothetical protein